MRGVRLRLRRPAPRGRPAGLRSVAMIARAAYDSREAACGTGPLLCWRCWSRAATVAAPLSRSRTLRASMAATTRDRRTPLSIAARCGLRSTRGSRAAQSSATCPPRRAAGGRTRDAARRILASIAAPFPPSARWSPSVSAMRASARQARGAVRSAAAAPDALPMKARARRSCARRAILPRARSSVLSVACSRSKAGTNARRATPELPTPAEPRRLAERRRRLAAPVAERRSAERVPRQDEVPVCAWRA